MTTAKIALLIVFVAAGVGLGVVYAVNSQGWDPGINSGLPVFAGMEANEGLTTKRTAAESIVVSILDAAQKLKLAEEIPGYERQVKKEPKSALKHFQLGYAYLLANSYEYVQASEAGVYHHDQLEKAFSELEKALQLDPTLSAAALTLGAHVFATDPPRAIKILEKLLKSDPGNVEAMLWLGGAYLNKKPSEVDASIETLQRLVLVRPKWARAHRFLGKAYMCKGRTVSANGKHLTTKPWRELAIAEYEEALKLPATKETHECASWELKLLQKEPLQ
ncbi:MAG: tetratricopeptide repeat protein [Armatimonadetes bacterium]|nr:tetratricopeptide repeat protein [Armatimonadota bacterium]